MAISCKEYKNVNTNLQSDLNEINKFSYLIGDVK